MTKVSSTLVFISILFCFSQGCVRTYSTFDEPSSFSKIPKSQNEVRELDQLEREVNQLNLELKSLIEDYDEELKAGEFEHQIVFLDTRDGSLVEKNIIASKIHRLGRNIGDKGLILMLSGDPLESKRALGEFLTRSGKNPANYSPSDGPFLIGQTRDKVNGKLKHAPVFIDFSGMNNECMYSFVENIEWALIHNLSIAKVEAKWRRDSVVCEVDGMVDAGKIPSIKNIYNYITSWYSS